MPDKPKTPADTLYTVTETALGWLLVGRTAQGICRVTLGGDPDALVSDLHRSRRGAGITRDDDALAPVVDELIGCLAGDTPHHPLKLDVEGSEFQRRVWAELRRIPRGTTITYSELANRIGKPSANRAVAGACGANPVAVLTPCHRVVRADGGLGGYRWGIERKRALLDAERAQVEAEHRRGLTRGRHGRASR